MAPRIRRARATTTEGRFLASRIQDAHRRGATNAEIGRAFGINERTVRKIRSGETTGKRTFERLTAPSREAAEKGMERGANPSIVRVDIKLGKDANGNDIVRTVNARIPTITNRLGQRTMATPADVFRIPRLEALIAREIDRLERQYGHVAVGGKTRVLGFRPIAIRRKPLRIEISEMST
jgi:hypothetical protein